MKSIGGTGYLSVMNMLSLLPSAKYGTPRGGPLGALYDLGIDRVVTDLYFTLPFDMGIVEARQSFTAGDDPLDGVTSEVGRVFIGEPFEVDCESSQEGNMRADYLSMIREARTELDD
jgi:hypothetical protein